MALTKTRLPRTAFLDALRKSGLVPPDDLIAFLNEHDPEHTTVTDPIRCASLFIRKKLITKYQAMQLLNGRTQGFVLGPYKIMEGIRQDRVGMAFHAEHNVSKKHVSVKVLPTDRASDPTILEAFVKEVRTAARVDHANVARVLDLNVWNSTYYVVTEYVPWPTLDKVLAEKGPLAPDAAAQIAAQVAVALKFAHDQGIVHRDIKPGNIAVGPNGAIKLIDLGLTHMLENPWKQVTRRISTKEYAEEIDHVAPEQAWGCEPDGRSDVYSLGSTVYTLLTGLSPFPGSAQQKMAERQVRDIPRPSLIKPEIPHELDTIVQKMGAKDPFERYQSATELIGALHPWLPVSQWVTLGLFVDTQTPPPAKKMSTAKPATPPGKQEAKSSIISGLFSLFKKS